MGHGGGDDHDEVIARVARRMGRLKARGLNLVEVVLTIGAFVLLRRLGAVAQTPVWVYVAMVAGGGALSALAFRWWGQDCSARQLHYRIAVNMLLSTMVIYATGWGPTLAIGYTYIATDAIKHSGARSATPSIVWSTVGIALGQLAIALGIAPTFVGSPEVHGLGVLAALALGFALYTAGITTAEKERAEADVRRSEERFRSLVQNGSDVVAVVTPLGELAYISPSIERMGFDAEEFFKHVGQIHPDDRARTAEAFTAALAEPDLLVKVETRLKHADGTWRWQDVNLTNRCTDPSVEGIVVNFHDITARKNFEAQLAHAAYHDRLTGLSNRAGFVQKLEAAVARARRDGLTTALLFLDLDRFKVINDSFGHNMGDHVLVDVAQRLRDCVRAEDTIGRFGGDEFTILVEDVHPGRAADLADRVTAALRVPLRLNGRELSVSASVGMVVTDTVDGADDLLRSADLAMYLAKENGRARWELFDPEMGSGILERYRIAAELRHAIEQGHLVTYYQPEISLPSGAVIGFEALVRWQHPERGLLLPGTFIPVAEDNDLILDIDRYVLESACRQLKLLQGVSGDTGSLFMSINISPACLNAPCVDELLRIVDEVGLDPTKLQLEITERTAVTESPSSLDAISRLRSAGVRLVIDDFGTGYSSLECLQRLPIDGLKIDRGFVADLDVTPTATAIVKAIVTLGHQLGLRLTAEGVETAAQLERLRSLGCDSAQGFHFARPLTASAAADLLRHTAVA
jgi:diguanylate cyclase (GGDEF)-like protein/PAS domain S-box-containing protein